MITRAFASFVLLGWVTSVYCLSPCSSLLLGSWRWATPAGRCGTGEKGLDMPDVALPAPGSVCEPKWWEEFSQNFVLTEDLGSCTTSATVASSSSSLLLLLFCTEIPRNKHVRILLLPHPAFPTEKWVSIFEGNSWTKQEVGQKMPETLRVGWRELDGKEHGTGLGARW